MKPNLALARLLLFLGNRQDTVLSMTLCSSTGTASLSAKVQGELAMKHLARTVSLLGVLFLLASCVPHNSCSSKDRIELKQGGFSMDEINNHCTSYKISEEFLKTAAQVVQSEFTKKNQTGNQSTTPVSQSSYQQNYQGAGAATCATQYGQCPLMQPGTNGSQCVCYTMYGQIPGVMR